jgi:hypothetical protein
MEQAATSKTFLSYVYKTNKFYFFVFAAFILIQLFVAYKRGMVFAPFFNYGMYSAVSNPYKQYPVLEIYSSGKKVNGSHYYLQTYDRVLLSYDYVQQTSYNRIFFETEIKRLLSKAHLPAPEEKFVLPPTVADSAFLINQWKQFAQKQLQIKIDSFRVVNYEWNGKKLVPTQL